MTSLPVAPLGVLANRKFCDTVKGVESSAIVYSLVETAKANRLDPYDYLFYILTMLPYLGKSPAHEELAKLMPWYPQVQAECGPQQPTQTE